MSKTVVITAHGRVDSDQSNAFVPSIDLITCSQFGEYHCGKLLDFQEISIFNEPNYLYKYVLHSGDNYTNKGKLYSDVKIPNIIFTPLENSDPVKMFSWQKPYVTTHLTKLCRYELANNPKYSGEITPFNIHDISLKTIEEKAKEDKDLSLLASTQIIQKYEDSFEHTSTFITNHGCSITSNNSRTVTIIDYEKQPIFGTKEWSLTDFLVDLNDFAQNIDPGLLGDDGNLGVESLIIKACLSD